MAKSKTKEAINTKPQVQVFMAEDLRQEVGGKITAVGLYADKTIVLPLPSDVPDPSQEHPIGIRSLGFLVNISNLDYETQVSMEIDTGQEVTQFMAPLNHGPIEANRSSNLVGVISPCVIASLGIRVLRVKVGKHAFDFPYEIRRDTFPMVTASESGSSALGVKVPAKRSPRKKEIK